MTPARVLRALARSLPLIIVCAVVGTALAFAVAKSHGKSAVATARLHVVTTGLAFGPNGDPVADTSTNRSPQDLSSSDFVVPAPAGAASHALGGSPSGTALQNALTMTPISPTDADLSLTAPTQDAAAQRLQAYVRAYVDWRRAAEIGPLQDAVKRLQAKLPNAPTEVRRFQMTSAIGQLQTAVSLIPEQIAPVGKVRTQSQGAALAAPVAAVGGALAGIALAVLLVLLRARLDTRVRSERDLHDAGLRPVSAGDGDTAGFANLRAELELAGVGTTAHVVAVTAPSEERHSAVALDLAEAFAAAGRSTVLVHAYEGDGSGASQATLPSGIALVYAADGRAGTMSGVERVIGDARGRGDVVVIDSPPLDRGAAALLPAAAADAVVVVTEASRTRWGALDRAVERLRNDTGARVLVALTPFRGRAAVRREMLRPAAPPSSDGTGANGAAAKRSRSKAAAGAKR